jgi:polyphenol oxidase
MLKPILSYEIEGGTFCTFTDLPEFQFGEVKQVHSNIVFEINTDSIPKAPTTEADAMVVRFDNFSNHKPPPLAIKTADCVPVLATGELGYAMIHAGWRGLANGILNQKSIHSINPDFFFIGPHIKWNNYEVSRDFVDNFPDSNSFIAKDGKIFFDLAQEVLSQLNSIYRNVKVQTADICTYTHPLLYSYRQGGYPKGCRNYNLFRPDSLSK